MYDYWKLRIKDGLQVQRILSNPLLEFKQTVNKATGEVLEYPQKAIWKVWEIRAFSPSLIEITGSIHKFWNGGTNESDFTFSDTKKAIKDFCQVFELNPLLVYVTNLEFGVNIHPVYNASDIIRQVICFKNTLPSHPYQNNDRSFFVEFKNSEAYIKLYDKGKQLKTTNILRIEVKGMKKRFFNFAGIRTLADLTKIKTIQALTKQLVKTVKHIVFKDDTIDIAVLNENDYNIYVLMKDATEWSSYKGTKTPAHRRKEKRFKEIVKQQGKRNIYAYMATIVEEKMKALIAA